MNSTTSIFWVKQSPNERKILQYIFDRKFDPSQDQHLIMAKHISKELKINRANVTRYLDNLKYQKLILLSKQGREVIVDLHEKTIPQINNYLRGLDDAQLKDQLLELQAKDDKIKELEHENAKLKRLLKNLSETFKSK